MGVQTERYPSMAARSHGARADCGGPTIAEGIAVPGPGALTGQIIEALVDDVLTVTEDAHRGGHEPPARDREGGGRGGRRRRAWPPCSRTASGSPGAGWASSLTGGNIDPRLLASVIMRGLVRNGRLTRLHIEVPDVPGSWATSRRCSATPGANIVEILHQRLFVDVSAKSAEVEVTIETLDHHHVDRVIAALERPATWCGWAASPAG